MDVHDIFKKLTSGAKFNFNKFRNDSHKPHINNPKPNPQITRPARNEVPLNSTPPENIIERGQDDLSNELVLLDSITSKDGKKTKKIKKELTKQKIADLEQEKISHFRNVERIAIVGRKVPAPVDSFNQLRIEYKLSTRLIDNLKNSGYSEPTRVQMQAIPIMLQGRQILACAPTGSGKTAAFLVPIIHELGGPRKKGFRAVIVCPTRELAKQTHRECLRLSEGIGLRSHVISKVSLAVTKFGPQSSQKFDILMTTPNRLVYLLKMDPPVLDLHNVQWLVVDESDKLFEAGDRGFRDQLAEIYRACDGDSVRRAMFSATHTQDVARWARKNLRGLISVTVGLRNTAAELVEQELQFVGSESGKLLAFRNLVHKGLSPPVLVFVQTKERARELFDELIYDGINVDIIHADRTQLQRDNVVRSFREGKIWVLVCTELMGRGIDFKGVNLVINFDFPPSAISYIHRIGRTGRAGRPGRAITFFTQDDSVNLRSIAQVVKDSGGEVPDYMLAMRKPSKRTRRQLEARAPRRDTISTLQPCQEAAKGKRRNRRAPKREMLTNSSETPEPKKQKKKSAASQH